MIQKALYKVGTEWAVGALRKSELLAKEAEEVLPKGMRATKPIKFGKPIRPAQATPQMQGANILAEQNKAMLVKPKLNFGKPTQHINPYSRMLSSDIQGAQRRFATETGATLHIGNEHALVGYDFGFEEGLLNLENWYKQGLIPKDIKHVLIGHGMGSAEMGSWVFWNGSAKGNVFNYINSHIPYGEKVLVLTCEGGTNTMAHPGIGASVATNLMYASSPAKIVKAGENKIIGHFYNPTALGSNGEIVGGATYY